LAKKIWFKDFFCARPKLFGLLFKDFFALELIEGKNWKGNIFFGENYSIEKRSMGFHKSYIGRFG
jgi:hypothetical protein